MPQISISARTLYRQWRFKAPPCSTVVCLHKTSGQKYPSHWHTSTGYHFCMKCMKRYILAELGVRMFPEALTDQKAPGSVWPVWITHILEDSDERIEALYDLYTPDFPLYHLDVTSL